jgi:hypothetical protein
MVIVRKIKYCSTPQTSVICGKLCRGMWNETPRELELCSSRFCTQVF